MSDSETHTLNPHPHPHHASAPDLAERNSGQSRSGPALAAVLTGAPKLSLLRGSQLTSGLCVLIPFCVSFPLTRCPWGWSEMLAVPFFDTLTLGFSGSSLWWERWAEKEFAWNGAHRSGQPVTIAGERCFPAGS